jgi:phospholipid-binding lipoprotein MlaA
MPQPARASVGRFLNNVGVIPRFANDLFQLQFEHGAQKSRASESIAPWVSPDCSIPLTNGLLKQEDNDFGLTLAKYGVDEGPYVVLPLLGRSSVRDAIGKAADGAMNPVNYVVSGATLSEAAGKPYLPLILVQRTWARLMM